MDARVYWRFVAISGAHLFAVQLVLPVLAPYLSGLGYSDSWISLVFGIFPFVMGLSAVVLGELSDGIGRTWAIRTALLLAATSYMLYFVGATWSIVLARFVDALAYTTLAVLLLARIEDELDDADRGRRTGLMLTVTTGLRMLGPVVGGWLADQYIGLPFFATTFIMLALAFSLRKGRFHRRRERISVSPLRSIGWFLSNRQLRPMALLGPFMHALQPALVVFLPLLVINELGLSYVEAGVAAMVYSIGSLLQFFYGDLADRLGSRRLIILGTSVKACALILIAAFADSFLVLLAFLALFSFGSGLWNVAAWRHMSEIAERERMEGRMVGTYMSVSKVGELASFASMGFVVASLGYRGVFFVLGLVGFIGIVGAAGLFYAAWLVERRSRASSAAA